jgi:hypothetical protein
MAQDSTILSGLPINQGMPRSLRHEPHTIDLDELLTDQRQETWELFSSSSREPKRFEVMLGGSGFRVTVRDVETYRGQNASDAVNAYNEAR